MYSFTPARSLYALTAGLVMASLVLSPDTAQGDIIVGNTAVSSVFTDSQPNAATMSFNNNGGALMVTLSIYGSNDLQGSITATASYNGAPVATAADFAFDGGRGWSGWFFLDNPALGDNDLSITLSTTHASGDPLLDAGGGYWQFGAISLSGVDESEPVADSYKSTNPSTNVTHTSSDFTAGDLLVHVGNLRSSGYAMDYDTPQNSMQDLYTSSYFRSGYGVLQAGDINGSNEVDLKTSPASSARGAHTWVYLNSAAIPEPSSIALISIGLIGLWTRRRRSA